MRHLANKKLEDLEFEELFPGLVLRETEHHVHQIFVTRSTNKNGDNILIASYCPKFESKKLTLKHFKKLQDEKRWYVVGGCLTDMVTGSLGGSPLFLMRGEVAQSEPTFDVTKLLDMDARHGDYIVDYHGKMSDFKKTLKVDLDACCVLYHRYEDQWLTAKEVSRDMLDFLP